MVPELVWPPEKALEDFDPVVGEFDGLTSRVNEKKCPADTALIRLKVKKSR
jgi:hypothetical protein